MTKTKVIMIGIDSDTESTMPFATASEFFESLVHHIHKETEKELRLKIKTLEERGVI